MTWTFGSGLHVPLTFEVLRGCCHDIVLGEEVLWDNDVFENEASSQLDLSLDVDFLTLEPFTFVNKWQRKFSERLSRKREHTGMCFSLLESAETTNS